MNKQDFKDIINLAEKDLIKDCEEKSKYSGVCLSLRRATLEVIQGGYGQVVCVVGYFRALSEPRDRLGEPTIGLDGRNNYWLGDNTPERLPRRLMALRLFEQYVISEKLYKEFRV